MPRLRNPKLQASPGCSDQTGLGPQGAHSEQKSVFNQRPYCGQRAEGARVADPGEFSLWACRDPRPLGERLPPGLRHQSWLGPGPGECLRMEGGTWPPCGPPEAPAWLESSFVCCQAPSSATSLTVAEWGGSVGHGHPQGGHWLQDPPRAKPPSKAPKVHRLRP